MKEGRCRFWTGSRSVTVVLCKHVSSAPALTFISSQPGELYAAAYTSQSWFSSERRDFRVFPLQRDCLNFLRFKKINKKIGLHFPPSNILEVMSSCCVLAGIVSRGRREDCCSQAENSG